MAEKNIQPVQPAADTANAEDTKTGEQRKTANFRGFRKVASFRGARKSGRKTNGARYGG